MKIHSYLSPKCRVLEKELGNKGVFAIEEIDKDELVAIWGGVVYSSTEIAQISQKYPHFLTHPVSIYEGFYLGPLDTEHLDDVEYMNHSCDPNVGVKGQIVLIARSKIHQGEEICFDYETTETDMNPMVCECGAKICRKKIDGNAWKNVDFQKKNKEFFSWYIEERIQQLS